MAVTAIRIICCILFGIASWFDERERMIPRLISYMECIGAIICWCALFFINRQFLVGNLLVSAGFFGVIFIFYLKGQIGRGDLYLVFSMLVLCCYGQPVMELIWKENLLFCIAFISASVRLLIQRLLRKKTNKAGCPFAIHLLGGFLIAMFV